VIFLSIASDLLADAAWSYHGVADIERFPESVRHHQIEITFDKES
jgi:hypothetical protein